MHIPTIRDARTGHRGRDAQTLQDGHDEAGGRRQGRTGPGEPGLLGRRPRRALGRRHRAGRAGAGWLYLAVVLNAWSRRIVGWAMASRMSAELVGDALKMAISTRGSPASRWTSPSVKRARSHGEPEIRRWRRPTSWAGIAVNSPAKCWLFDPVFWLFEHNRFDHGLTARTADRAVHVELRRLLAGIPP
ncbi:MAG: DDE-type integrase/transposase/recombinase, partial [Gammaproteobacteria bacterium]|nr:DDE-type integrase/transposase/recombinase [Gammaproteobacteria bacterium]